MNTAAVIVTVVAAAIGLLTGRSDAQQPSASAQVPGGKKSVLIVYLSRTSNTKAVAEFIHQRVGGTIVPIEVEKPYPANYNATVQQVARENETGYLPPLRTKIGAIEQYDVVFIGFPTWGMQLPPPVKSFLSHHNLKGKAVVPFNTNAGYGVGTGFETVKDLCSECRVLEGFSTRGGVERDGQDLVIRGVRAQEVQREVERWLKKIGDAVAQVPLSR